MPLKMLIVNFLYPITKRKPMPLRYTNISGHEKNRDKTMERLIDAVGTIIKNKGYKGLGLNAIAKEAGVSKILIHRYFGGVDQLIEAYVLKNDYWMAKNAEVDTNTSGEIDRTNLKKLVSDLLKGHFEYFYTHE